MAYLLIRKNCSYFDNTMRAVFKLPQQQQPGFKHVIKRKSEAQQTINQDYNNNTLLR